MEQRKTSFQFALYYGILLSAISIIWGIIGAFIPEETRKGFGAIGGISSFALSIGITCYVIWLALKTRKEEQEGFIAFGEGVNISAWMGVVSASIGVVWTYIYLYVIDTSIFKNALNAIRDEIEKGDLSSDKVDEQMKFMEFFFSPTFVLPTTWIWGFLVMLILGVIVSAIVKQEKEHPF
jgi:putative Mn2+ efflux pump MntP